MTPFLKSLVPLILIVLSVRFLMRGRQATALPRVVYAVYEFMATACIVLASVIIIAIWWKVALGR